MPDQSAPVLWPGAPTDVPSHSFLEALVPHLAQAGYMMAIHDRNEDGPAQTQAAANEPRFQQNWNDHYAVEDLHVGDHIRHAQLGYSPRIVAAVKPLAKGGVQVKTRPAYVSHNRSSNPEGKTLKHDITGFCRRWDGKSEIEITD